MKYYLLLICYFILLTGCVSYGVIDNRNFINSADSPTYSLLDISNHREIGDISLTLTFSGGGTRASALAYGVLQELRDTTITVDNSSQRLLDQVDYISSVSGGSFTSAYYGLYGDKIFDSFETDFLRKDFESPLIRRLFNPYLWFSSTDRTEQAVDLFDKELFHGATFRDLQQKKGPLIIINASDLAYGVRFSFLQDYFNLLCSDISTFPIARAVVASAAVPVLFTPVVLENYNTCNKYSASSLLTVSKNREEDIETEQLVEGLNSYINNDNRNYVHLVDGGITDNLGVRSLIDIIDVAGGMKEVLYKTDRQSARTFIIISVDASIERIPEMDYSSEQPSIAETISAVSDVQLQRYNAATLSLLDEKIGQWAQDISTPDRPITTYIVQVSLRDLNDENKDIVNNIRAGFALTSEEVDAIILSGRKLLQENKEFQRFLSNVNF